MRGIGHRFLLLSLLLLIAACAGGTFGPGGTGITVGDRGIGGTGITVGDRGIGGTGIVGTVTAFGSVWVNGLRVDLPPTVAVRVEGREADRSAIQIGHLVAMTAAPGGPTGLAARTLEVRYAVAGPVDRVEGGVIRLLGQRVDVSEAEGRSIAATGAWVAVSGLRRPDGVIVASRVDPRDAAEGWLLRGRLDAVTSATLTVAGVALARDGARDGEGDGLSGVIPPVDAAVRVSGRAGAGVSAVVPDPFNPFGAAVGALSVETYVDASAGMPGAVSGSRVVIDSTVESGGGLAGSRAFGAPALGGTAAFGADPAARAAGLARAGARGDGLPGEGAFGATPFGASPFGAAPAGVAPDRPDTDPRSDDGRGWGRSHDGFGPGADPGSGLSPGPGSGPGPGVGADGPDRGSGHGPRGGMGGPPGGGPPGSGPPGGGPSGRGGVGGRAGAAGNRGGDAR